MKRIVSKVPKIKVRVFITGNLVVSKVTNGGRTITRRKRFR